MIIIYSLEREALPKALVSACFIMKADFWRDWVEYEAACSHCEIISWLADSPASTQIAETMATRGRLGAEVEKVHKTFFW